MPSRTPLLFRIGGRHLPRPCREPGIFLKRIQWPTGPLGECYDGGVTLRNRLSRWLRRMSYLWSPRHRHSCLKCGFLSFDRREASSDVRFTVAAKGTASWFLNENAVDCYKRLWLSEFSQGAELAIYEANRPRFHCAGFVTHLAGRSPEQHLKLEDENREFRRKLILSLIPITIPPLIVLLTSIWGGLKLAVLTGVVALIGAVGAAVGLRHH